MKLVLPQLHPGQQEVWDSKARFKVVCCGRRWGKTHLGVLLCIMVAARGGRAWWVAPSYPVANIGWRLLLFIIRPIPGVQISASERRITLPGGGEIQVKSADNPDSLRGEALDFVVMDECAQVKPEAWFEALRPSLSDRKGGALFIGTPKGMDNWFYDIWQRSETRDDWSRWQKPTIDNPVIDEAEIAEAREELGELVFSQEYLAEFIVTGGLVFKPEWEHYYTPFGDLAAGYDRSTILTFIDPVKGLLEQASMQNCIRFTTVDLAVSTKTSADYTVISTWGQTPQRRTALLDVVRKRMEAPDTLKELEAVQKKWRPSWQSVEKTAFQLAMVQFGRSLQLPIRELVADKDKMSGALHAAARMESGHLWWPDDAAWLPDWQQEVRAFPQAKHDDQVDTQSYAAELHDQIRRGPQLASW